MGYKIREFPYELPGDHMTFDTAIERVLSHEGGYVWDPNDRGLETHWGISKRAHPDVDIRNLTREGAIEIYRREYWSLLPIDLIPSGVRFPLFDMAVHHGPTAAKKALQRAISVEPDGIIGPITLAALRRMRSTDLVMLLAAERLEDMTDAPTWRHHGRGWARRMAVNLRFAVEDDKRDA